MTNDSTSIESALPQVLEGLAAKAKAGRHTSASYAAMAASTSIGQVVRRLEHATTGSILDAFDVLTTQFGMADTHELLDALTEIPFRYRVYRRGYEAETHVGCVDRTVTRLAHELKVAGGLEPGEAAAADALVLATQADQAQRIQRLSCDAREITRRIAVQAPDLPEDKLHRMIRLVLTTAAEIVHEHDGLE
jgi:hypothetical protein